MFLQNICSKIISVKIDKDGIVCLGLNEWYKLEWKWLEYFDHLSF